MRPQNPFKNVASYSEYLVLLFQFVREFSHQLFLLFIHFISFSLFIYIFFLFVKLTTKNPHLQS